MKKGEKRKLELLKIAYGMFITKGYENTSVDGIIEEAGIAKGTFYYYFESKEQLLEDVIEMMLDEEIAKAEEVLSSDLPIPQRIVGIIASIRPGVGEKPIEDALHEDENAFMHNKVNKRIVERLVPLLTRVAEEGISTGVFDCDNVPERVKVILILSNNLFNEPGYTPKDIEVFIDLIEKLLGAKKGTMDFVKALIDQPHLG